MLNNWYGGDRKVLTKFNINLKASEKANFKGIKPLVKPRLFQLKRDITAKKIALKDTYKNYQLSLNVLATEYESYIKLIETSKGILK
jgi:hypothetical protein